VSVARYNRGFLRRSARLLAESGIRQFLDLGSGIPTAGNVHEVVHRVDPSCRVVYVDNEWIAAAHSKLLLESQGNVAFEHEDLRDVSRVLKTSAVSELLDLSQPVAVLMYAVLHFIPDSDHPADIVAAYRDATAPGSYLAISHGTIDHDPERLADVAQLYQRSTTPLYVRTHTEVRELFAGYELLDPGVVYTPQWRPEAPDDVPENPELATFYAAVGRVNSSHSRAVISQA
ncbi:MAG: SAM-dependent methyltransferase, partial [Sciscionella sp.]